MLRIGLWIQLFSAPLIASCALGSEGLRVDAVQHAHESVLTVSVATAFPKCDQLLLDRAVGRVETSARPISILNFDVVEASSGKRIAPRQPVSSDKTRLAAGDLVLATCWSRFSWLVDLTEYPWLYELESGTKYRVRVCFKSNVKTFFQQHTDERRRLVSKFGFYETELDRKLQDLVGCSEEVEFTLFDGDNPRAFRGTSHPK